MNILLCKEHELNAELKTDLNQLLRSVFDGYPEDRCYLHQIPTFRILAMKSGRLLGHAAIDHRVVNIAGINEEVWGVVDFCVAPEKQGKGLGKKLIQFVIQEGKKANIPFLLLLSKDSSFYEKQKFVRKHIRAKWVMIFNGSLFGIQERTMKDTLYVLPLGEKNWSGDFVDFLGPLF